MGYAAKNFAAIEKHDDISGRFGRSYCWIEMFSLALALFGVNLVWSAWKLLQEAADDSKREAKAMIEGFHAKD